MAGSGPGKPPQALADAAASSLPIEGATSPIDFVERLLANGERDRATRVAFDRALADLIRSTGVPGRPELTGREFLVWALGPGSPIAPLREPFDRLRRLYEPARFGDGAASVDGLVEALTEIYRRPELARLYRGARVDPRSG